MYIHICTRVCVYTYILFIFFIFFQQPFTPLQDVGLFSITIEKLFGSASPAWLDAPPNQPQFDALPPMPRRWLPYDTHVHTSIDAVSKQLTIMGTSYSIAHE